MALDQNSIVLFLSACPRGATLGTLVVQFGCEERAMQQVLADLLYRGAVDRFDSMEAGEDGVMRYCINSDWKYREGYGTGSLPSIPPGDSLN